MKASGYIMILLIITLGLTSVRFILDDMNTYYNVEINDTRFKSNYDNTAAINKSVGKVRDSLEKFDESRGLLGGIITGGFVVVRATIMAIQQVVSSIPWSIGILVGIFTTLNAPIWAISIFVIMLILAVVFALMQVWRRYPF